MYNIPQKCVIAPNINTKTLFQLHTCT